MKAEDFRRIALEMQGAYEGAQIDVLGSWSTAGEKANAVQWVKALCHTPLVTSPNVRCLDLGPLAFPLNRRPNVQRSCHPGRETCRTRALDDACHLCRSTSVAHK